MIIILDWHHSTPSPRLLAGFRDGEMWTLQCCTVEICFCT